MNPAPTLILYHADCPDGFGAAWSYWKKLGDRARYVPYHYNQKTLPNLIGEDVLMVDVSDTPERLDLLRAKTNSFRLIDHHETAAEALRDQPYAHFDVSHSGAWLAWKDAHGEVPPPRLLRMIEARDLLTWTEPHAREALFVLDSLPRDFRVWDEFHHRLQNDLLGVVDEGRPMAKQYDRFIDRLVEQAASVTLAGVPGLLTNAPHVFANDVGARLHVDQALAMSWYLDHAGVAHLSFRAERGVFNIIPLAEALHGGGSQSSGAARVTLNHIQKMYAGEDILAHDQALVAQMKTLHDQALSKGQAELTRVQRQRFHRPGRSS